MTRAEHLQWCKDRAIKELNESGSAAIAYASFVSDMSQHEELQNHSALQMGTMMLLGGHNQSIPEMTRFIEGFN